MSIKQVLQDIENEIENLTCDETFTVRYEQELHLKEAPKKLLQAVVDDYNDIIDDSMDYVEGADNFINHINSIIKK